MFGRLTYQDLPFYSPIAFSGAMSEVVVGIVIVGLVLWYRKLGYLWHNWLTSVDHKRIGIMYIVVALVMLVRGFADASMMRAQQAMALNSEGYLAPDHFDQVFSVHGTIMIFFVAMAFLTGLINIIMPMQIGSRDVAFPLLNLISFYLTFVGAALVLLSLVIGQFSTAGWTGYATYSEAKYTPGTGVEYWAWALLVSGVGTTLSGVNFITTIFKKRAPGMFLMRMPLFSWTSLVTSTMMVATFPALTAAVALLELDRLADFHFFTEDKGGNVNLFIDILWLWGHPEVYILILPAFGVYSEVVATFCRKNLFSYVALVYATAVIGVLSLFVWLHHFFTMGASPKVNSVFSILTMIIAIPTGVKIFNWIFTMYRGRITFHTSMLWTLGFIFNFVIGGMTGVIIALPPVDYLVHNTVFLIAHFHNVAIPGVLFGLLAGMNYWFPKCFGFKLDEKWGNRAFFCWVIGFFVAFMPLYPLGLMGLPRRMQQYSQPEFQPYLIVAALGVVIIFGGVICQVVQLVVSIKNRKLLADVTGDPWNARTLEWWGPSPALPYNFAVVPTVHSRDAFWDMKQRGVAYDIPTKFEDIVMPRNSGFGVAIGAICLLLGAAVTFYMWWLAITMLVAGVVTVILIAFRKNTHYIIPAEEVEKTYREWLESARPLLVARDRVDAIENDQPLPASARA